MNLLISDLLTNGFIYGLTGAVIGLVSGVLGIGGGILVVPALLFLFRHHATIPPEVHMHLATGTSLAIMIFTSQASVRTHIKLGHILWDIYHRLWPGIIIGVITGAIAANFMPTNVLKIVFGLFLLAIAGKMTWGIEIQQPKYFPSKYINRLISFLIGFKSGLLGVGGGVLIIPYLTYCGVEVRKITAISALCTLTVATVGSVIVIMTGLSAHLHLAWSVGYVYLPAVLGVAIPSMIVAPWGAKLTYSLPIRQLRYAFVIILVVTALNLLI